MVRVCIDLDEHENRLLERLSEELGLPKRRLVLLVIRYHLALYERYKTGVTLAWQSGARDSR